MIFMKMGSGKEGSNMKYVIMTVIGVVLSLGVSFAGDKLELKDQNQKESYILGYKYGENFKKQGMDINVEDFAAGLKDATGGNPSQMTQDEIAALASVIHGWQWFSVSHSWLAVP